MHIASVFHCPNRADARELGYNLAQYNLSLIQAMLEQDRTLRVEIITSRDGLPLLLRPSLGDAVESGALTIRPLLKRNTWSLLSLAWRLRWKSYDAVHFQHETYHYGGALSLFALPLLLGFLRLWTHPVVTLHHVLDTRNFTRMFSDLFATRLPPTMIRWGFTLFYRLVGWTASSIIVHEPCDQIILADQYRLNRGKIVVIPHGSDDTYQPSSCDRDAAFDQFGIPRDAENVFGFFSYFDLSKGIDFLIPEFLEHLQTHPRDVLIVAGARNPYHLQHRAVRETINAMQALAEREGRGRILWTGFLSPDRAVAFYRTVDCIIAPYRIFNGGSAAIAKSFGSRVPILLSESFAACIQNPSLTFALAPHALSSALRLFTESPEYRTRIMEQIDTWRRERLWPAIGQKTLACYQTLKRNQPAAILLLGAYGQKNLGDELLLSECLRHLPRELCVVASADPQETAVSQAVQAVPSRLSVALFFAFLRARTLVIGGGDQFKLLKPTMGSSRHSLLVREALLILVSKMLRKQIVFVGVGIGDISTRAARTLTGLILRCADTVILRDRESDTTARKLAPRARISWGADLAFLQKPSPSHQCSVPQETGFTVGIAPACHFDDPHVSLHVARELAKALDGFLMSASDHRALFLPFQTGSQVPNDLRTIQEIRSSMQEQDRCRTESTLSLTTVKDVYQSFQYLWGMRLHSLILATLYAVPFIALIYDVKVKNFLQEIDCEEWGISLNASFTAEKLLALQRKLEEQLPEIRTHLSKQADRLRERSQTNAELLRDISGEIHPISALPLLDFSSDARQTAFALHPRE